MISMLALLAAYVAQVLILDVLFGLSGRWGAYVNIGISWVFLWPILALSAKRLHDRDIPAMPRLLLIFGPFYVSKFIRDFELDLSLATFTSEQSHYLEITPFVFVAVYIALCLFVMAELFLTQGSAGENDFGPDPYG